MLKTRIVTAVALAAGVALGASGCGFIVPQATEYVYAPSDGIDVNLPNANVRNLFVVTGEGGANVVFTGATEATEDVRVSIKLTEQGTQIGQRNFTLQNGLTAFGVDPHEVIAGTSLQAGSMVTAFIESDGVEVERQVPVLDGTLAEYAELVP